MKVNVNVTLTKVKKTQRYEKGYLEPTDVLRNTNVLLLSDDSKVSFMNFSTKIAGQSQRCVRIEKIIVFGYPAPYLIQLSQNVISK